MIRYELPYPPTTNHLFANVGRGRMKTDAYRAWREVAGYAIIEQGRKRIHGHVSLSIALVKPDKRRRDLSNSVKAIEDLLVSMAVIDDDSLVQRIDIQWASSGAPCCVIIQEATEALAA